MEYWQTLGTVRHYAYRVMLFAGLGFLAVGSLPYLLPPRLIPGRTVLNALLFLTVGGFLVGATCSLLGWLRVQYGLARGTPGDGS